MYVFHNATSLLTPVILTKGSDPTMVAIIIDSEGRGHRIPANEPWEVKPQTCMDTDKGGSPVQLTIPAEKVAAQLVHDGKFFGLVIVNQIRTANGISFDVEAAAKESKRIREQAETDLVEKYVKSAKDEQLGNRAIRPPAAPIEQILSSRGMDLKRDYGLEPVGYRVSEKAAARDKEMDELRKENREIKEMLNMLLEDKKDEKRKKESAKA